MGICTDMCKDSRIDMCAIGVHIGMCVAKRKDVRIDMRVAMRLFDPTSMEAWHLCKKARV